MFHTVLCVSVYTHMCMYTYIGQRLTSVVFLYISLFYFEGVLSLSLAAQQAPPPQLWDYNCIPPHLASYLAARERTQSSCWHGKCVSDLAIFLGPQQSCKHFLKFRKHVGLFAIKYSCFKGKKRKKL